MNLSSVRPATLYTTVAHGYPVPRVRTVILYSIVDKHYFIIRLQVCSVYMYMVSATFTPFTAAAVIAYHTDSSLSHTMHRRCCRSCFRTIIILFRPRVLFCYTYSTIIQSLISSPHFSFTRECVTACVYTLHFPVSALPVYPYDRVHVSLLNIIRPYYCNIIFSSFSFLRNGRRRAITLNYYHSYYLYYIPAMVTPTS